MSSLMIPDIGVWVGQYMWPMARVSAFMMAIPIISSRLVPVRVRMLFSLVITIMVVPQLESVPAIDPLTLRAWLMVAEQILIGIALGFIFQIFFHVAVLGGQIMAMQTGLGFSSMMDPSSGFAVTSVSQFYMMLFTLLFLAMNGHLVLFDYLFRSFTVIPLGSGGGWNLDMEYLARLGGWMMAGGLLVSLPVVVALLVINLALGVMTRAAPQLNIFSIGFPITLLLGLVTIWLSLLGIEPVFHLLADEAFDHLQHVLMTQTGG